MSFPQPKTDPPPSVPKSFKKIWIAVAVVATVFVVEGAVAWKTFFTHAAPLRIDPFGLGSDAVIARGAAFDNRSEVKALPDAVRRRYLAAEAAQEKALAPEGDSVWEVLRRDADFPVERARGILASMDWKPQDDSLHPTAAALTGLDSALARWPSQALLLYLRGRMLEALGQPDSAQTFYLRAEQISPRFAFARARVGEWHFRHGDWKRAENEYRAAFSLWKTDSAAYTGRNGAIPTLEPPPFADLALLFYQRGYLDSAMLVLDYAAQNHVSDQDIEYLRGRIDEEHDQFSAADSIYRALAARYPDRARYAEAVSTLGLKPPHGALGAAAHASAVFAISLLEPLTQRFPQDAALRLALGKAYLYRGLPALAASSLDTALRLDASMADARILRDAAYRAWNEAAPRRIASDTASAPKIASAPRGDSLSDDDGGVKVIEPGSTGLLGTYDVAWGATPEDVRRAYPGKMFTVLPNGDLRETFSEGGWVHDYLLAFKKGMLWGVYVRVTDTTRSGSDLFGQTLQLKSKISGEGKGTGVTTCDDGRPFQGVIWENDDTFEFLAQYSGHENQVRLARIAEANLPGNHRVCDVERYLDPAAWR